MKDTLQPSHLPPEVFVDLLEGVPVDASWRQHLETCAACQGELEQLEQTLALLNTDVDIEAPTSPAPTPPRRSVAWVASVAAAALFAVSVGYWVSVDSESTAPTTVAVEELLPPVDDDDAFQLLLALSNVVDEELSNSLTIDEPTLDPTRLTPEEQQRFVERLAEEMRSSL